VENNTIYSYRDLIVWQRAIEMVVAVYELTKSSPKGEIRGLTGQLKSLKDY